MSYGDYYGHDKPNKGKEGGACNRARCQAEPALWFNHGSYSWYCAECRHEIETDGFNRREWLKIQRMEGIDHPMFETREMMDARK